MVGGLGVPAARAAIAVVKGRWGGGCSVDGVVQNSPTKASPGALPARGMTSVRMPEAVPRVRQVLAAFREGGLRHLLHRVGRSQLLQLVIRGARVEPHAGRSVEQLT